MKASTATVDPDIPSLVDRCRTGDGAAFRELVVHYQDRVLNICWRVCGNRSEAEDLTQETFVKAFTSLDLFDGRAAFYTWLFRIAVNTSISARRKASRRPTVSLDGAVNTDHGSRPTSAGERLAADEAGPSEAAHSAETREAVRIALAALDKQQRAVVVLRDMESLSYEEIAEILQVPAGTVKSRLHRARLALRDHLSPILGMT